MPIFEKLYTLGPQKYGATLKLPISKNSDIMEKKIVIRIILLHQFSCCYIATYIRFKTRQIKKRIKEHVRKSLKKDVADVFV